MQIALRPLNSRFGAEVAGIDLSRPLDAETFEQIEQAFDRHSLLLFRGQTMSEEDHVALSRRFGTLQSHVLKPYLSNEHPELLVLSNIKENGRPTGIGDAGQIWHADTSYVETPCRCSLLLGREIPEPVGDRTFGDTVFLSAAAAYDALPEERKSALARLTAPHSFIHYYKLKQAQGSDRPDLTKEQESEVPPVDQPVVLAHPITGRKAIYVNPSYTTKVNELPEAEGAALLAELFAHLVRPEFVYRHQWRPGDLIIWDNYATQHLAIGDYALPQRRLMHRTTVLLRDDAKARLAEIRKALV
ncbi:MAG: TauD/TfdA family dioxygenase [Reyranellaceae bacterium]